MPERDWKVFRRVHEAAMNRYFEQLLKRAVADAQDETKPPKERYNDFYYAARERDKTLRDVFDDFRRSTALLQLLAMNGLGVVTEEEKREFSEETQALLQQFSP